ncbi:hypothetical protein QYF61_021613 [Mycteria americana]|uniref:ribonuclease H n=1 Tax=Mycteria americana TaxID=33587 RepID=A0AAN7SJ61_MYCAM|nr:hypothetical protein QYF61_021613 [Mycteria americana]
MKQGGLALRQAVRPQSGGHCHTYTSMSAPRAQLKMQKNFFINSQGQAADTSLASPISPTAPGSSPRNAKLPFARTEPQWQYRHGFALNRPAKSNFLGTITNIISYLKRQHVAGQAQGNCRLAQHRLVYGMTTLRFFLKTVPETKHNVPGKDMKRNLLYGSGAGVEYLDTSECTQYTKAAFSTQSLHLVSHVPRQSQDTRRQQTRLRRQEKVGDTQARGARKELRNFGGAEAASSPSNPPFPGYPPLPRFAVGFSHSLPTSQFPEATEWRSLSPQSPTAAPTTNCGATQGVISKTCSPLNSPIWPVRKSNGEWRLTVDYRGLDEVTPLLSAAVPGMLELQYELESKAAKWYATTDITNAFFSIPLAAECRPQFAFTWRGVQYTWNRLPQGWKQSPTICHGLIQTAVEQGEAPEHLQYLDDLIMWGNIAEGVFEKEKKIVQILLKPSFAIKQSKVKGPAQEIQFLGIK